MIARSWLTVLLLGLGCGPTLPSDSGSGSGSGDGSGTTTLDPDSGSSATTVPSTSTSTTGVPPSTTSDTGIDPDGSSEGFVFIMEPDGGGICGCCDPFAQDCPSGEKCVAWDPSGGNRWDSTRCSSIPRNPGHPSDPCSVINGPDSGLDDCDLGSMCWGVDPETLEGTCVATCSGAEDDPVCPPTTDCVISNSGVLLLCLPTCDPLASACASDEACVPSEHAFACMSSTYGAGAGPGQACDQVYDCQPGLLCRSVLDVGPPCDPGDLRCCTPYCDLSVPDPTAGCLDPAQACTSWWGARVPPAGYEDVGFCAQ